MFLLIWLGFAWILWSHTTPKSFKNISVHRPLFRQNCNVNQVPCVDDCEFLCVENDAQCIGGVCRSNPDVIECNERTGGVVMAMQEPTLHWLCVCTDSAFFQGPTCDTLKPDVCEHGLFVYEDRDNFQCLCFPPYKLIFIHSKPHCVEKYVINFFSAENSSYENHLRKKRQII